MIKVTENFGIDVDERCHISGKITMNKKGETRFTDKRYHSKITSALSSIAERTAKEKLSERDYSLDEAVLEISQIYNKFSDMVDNLENMLVIRELIPNPKEDNTHETY